VGNSRGKLTPGPALHSVLKKGVPDLTVLVGEEDFLKDDALRQIRGRLGPDADVEVIDGPRNAQEDKDFDPASVFDGLRTGSLFGGERAIVVRNADRFVAGSGDGLSNTIENPVKGAALVLFLKKLDGRKKLGKLVASRGLKVSCDRLYDRPSPWERGRVPAHEHELSRWTAARANALGKRMTTETAHVLTRHTGNDLGRIAGALKSLVVFLGDKPEIDAETVEKLVAGTGEETAFRLCDEILEGGAKSALTTLETMYRSGMNMGGKSARGPEAVSMIVIATLKRKLRDAYRARRALEDGMSPPDVVASFGPKSRGFVDVFKRQLMRYDEKALRRALKGLRTMEAAFKSGGAPEGPDLALVTFVVDLCRTPPPGRERTRGSRTWA
jgi:DNA polymerase III delta subunit